jgi:biotin carboxylase
VAAGGLGFYTVLLTNRETFLEKRTEFPDVHEMIQVNLEDTNEIRNKLKFLRNQGKEIVAISSFIEPYVYTAALLGQECGLPSQTPEAIAKMLDKICIRQLLQGTPYSSFFSTCDDSSVVDSALIRQMPIVVKSPVSTGSKDVILATNRMELKEQITRLKRRYPEQKVLLEDYLEGPQYLVEVLVHKGTPYIVAVVEQMVRGKHRFIVTGYRVLPKVPIDLHNQIEDMVDVVVQRTGMRTGALHIEFRLVDGHCKIIEVNPRISGSAMNSMIHIAFGINLVEQTLKSQMGQTPNLEPKCKRYVFTQFVTVSQGGVLQRVTGKQQASRCVGVEEVRVKPRIGAILNPPTSMGHRYAYVLAAADSEREAETSARKAARLIQFHLTPERGELRDDIDWIPSLPDPSM